MNGGENQNFDGSSDSGAQNSEHQKHSVIGSRRYRGPSDEQKYAAATNLANNPNTPEFFSEAVMANTATPQPRKSHKKLIISSIVALVLVATIIAVLIFNISRGPRTLSEDGKNSFYSFANYYFLGVESSNRGELTNYNIKKQYSAAEQKQYDKDYNQKLESLYDSFFQMALNTSVDSNNNPKYERLNTNIMFITSHYPYGDPNKFDPTESDAFHDYKEVGYEASIELIRKKYSAGVNDANSITSSYASALRERDIAYIKYVDIFRSIGCLTNSGIKRNCNTKSIPNEQADELQNLDDLFVKNERTAIELLDNTYKATDSILWEMVNENNQ